MKYFKQTLVAGFTVVAAAGTWGLRGLTADQPAFKRTELQRQDLSAQGREAVQARGDFMPGAVVPRHTHPGEELSYVIAGEIVLEIDGKPPQTLKAGEVFFVPAGTIHSAKNASKSEARVLSTYVVEKGKPLATPVK